MGKETLERLLVTIDGSTELLRQELRKGGVDVDRWARDTQGKVGKVGSSFSKLGPLLRTSMAALGVGFGATAFTNFVRGAVQAADAIGESARAAGFGAERFQRLQFVFRQNGVEAQEFEGAMRTANTRLGQFITTGAGPAAKAIEQLGIKQRITNGEIRNGEQFVDAILEALGKVENTAQRAALAAVFFGRELGAKMQDTLGQGKAAIDELAAAASGIFTDETVRKADLLGDAWAKIAGSVGNYAKSLAIAASYDASKVLGVDAVVADANRPENRLAALKARRDRITRPELANVTELQRRAELTAEIEQLEKEVEHNRLLNTPFITTRAPVPGMRADGRPSESSDGLKEISVRQRRAGSMAEIRDARRVAGMRELAPDFGLSEIKTPERIRMPADLQQMPDWQPMIARAEEYAKTVDAARERQQRFADTLAATFESRGVAAFFSGKPRDAIKGLGQDFAELVIRMAVLQPIAEKLAATLSGIGFGAAAGGGGGFFASLGSIFGFAGGGRPPVGRPSWVGERGRELFVPDVPGRIYSHRQSMQMAGGGPSIGSIHVDARGATDPAAVRAEVERGVYAAVSIADSRTDAKLRAAMRPAIA